MSTMSLMSLKTTTAKRVTLIAVAALGFGMVSGIAANAAVSTARTVTTDFTTVANGYVGANSSVNVKLTTTTATDAAETITVTPTIVSAPTGSSVTVGAPGAGKVGLDTTGTLGTDIATTATANKWTDTTASGVNSLSWSSGTIPALSAENIGTLTLNPDKQGTYVIRLTSASSGATGTDTVATVTFYVSDLYALTADGLTGGNASNVVVNGVSGTANTVTLQAVGQTTPRLVTVSGAGGSIFSAGTNITVSGDRLSGVVGAGTAGALANNSLVIATPNAGTITVSLFDQSQPGVFKTTPTAVVTINVANSAINGALDVAHSSITMTAVGSGTLLSSDGMTLTAPRTASTQVGSIAVNLVALAGTLPSTTTTMASISGPGYITFGGATGRSLIVTGATPGSIGIFGDGTSGSSTITVTSGGFSASRVVNFYGPAATYSISSKSTNVAVGSTVSPVFTVKAVDSAGIAIPNSVIYVSSANTAVATVTASQVTTGADGSAVNVGVTGVSAGTDTITVGNAPSSPTVSATFNLTVVKAGIASVAVTFDKDTYGAGEKATITVTAKNSDGALAGDGTYANFFTAAGLTSSVQLQGYTPSPSVALVNGVATFSVFMPLASGPVTINGVLGSSVDSAIQGTTVSATATVSANADVIDAVNEATDAANAATDAANAAAEAADAATAAANDALQAAKDASAAVAALATSVAASIAGLRARLTTLVNLIVRVIRKTHA